MILLAFLAVGATLYADLICASDTTSGICSNVGVGKSYSILALIFVLPLFSVINGLHMWIVYEIKVARENIFNTVGLVGMTTTYIFYSFQRAFSETLLAPTENLIKSFIYLMVGITAIIFMNDPHLWESPSFFLKFRVMASIIFVMIYTYSPQIGLLTGLILLPPIVLIPDNTADFAQDTSAYPNAPAAPNLYPSNRVNYPQNYPIRR
ncbi:MAG: hypothetical protein OHK0017_06840 [Patescibacteria group bacterium]